MTDIWDDLHRHHAATKSVTMAALFAKGRDAADFSASADGLLFDYAKTTIDATARDLLLHLAEASGLAARRAAMFAGERINETEGRAVLHTALRNLDAQVMVDGRDVMAQVRATHARAKAFAVDDRVAFIGSYNVDPRSANINTELGVLIFDKQLVQGMHQSFDDAMLNVSYQVRLDPQGKLQWHTQTPEGTPTQLNKEPKLSWINGLWVKIFSALPITSLL
jgi:phosphatidylserine/phosphatidylglycerophosphate/cardiolipin synthase-like enzyme